MMCEMHGYTTLLVFHLQIRPEIGQMDYIISNTVFEIYNAINLKIKLVK